MNWNDYLTSTRNSKPRHLLVEAFPYVKNREYALDLGAGALNDTKEIIIQNFKNIDIVDSNPSVGIEVRKLTKKNSSVLFFHESFDTFDFSKNKYDLVNAQYALPFAGPDYIYKVLQKIEISLKENGIFTGNFFGMDDEWFTNPKLAFFTKEQLEDFFNLSKWIIHKFEEVRIFRPTADGRDKRWHLFEIIAAKAPSST